MKKNYESARQHLVQTNNIEIILQLYKLEKAAANKRYPPLLPMHDHRKIVTRNKIKNQKESNIIHLFSDYIRQASQIFFKRQVA